MRTTKWAGNMRKLFRQRSRPKSRSLANLPLHTDGVTRHVRSYPGEVFEYSFVARDGINRHAEFLGWPEGFIWGLSSATINVPTGLVSGEGYVWEESNIRYGSAADAAFVAGVDFSIRQKTPTFTTSVLLDDTPKFYLSNPNRNYHQWLEFTVPLALQVREMNPEVQFLSSTTHPGFFMNFLEKAGIHPLPLSAGNYQVRNLILANGRKPFLPHHLQIDLTRKFFFSNTVKKVAAGSKIYLSRVGSSRSFHSEEYLEEALRLDGWTVLRAEDTKDISNIASLFQSAQTVAGPHGAGFSNLIFSESGTRVREIAVGDFWKPSYSRLSFYRDLPYSLLMINANSIESIDPVVDFIRG